jgi:hypothetical protein
MNLNSHRPSCELSHFKFPVRRFTDTAVKTAPRTLIPKKDPIMKYEKSSYYKEGKVRDPNGNSIHSEDSNQISNQLSQKSLLRFFSRKNAIVATEKSSIEKPRKKSRSKEGDCSPVASRMGGKKESKGSVTNSDTKGRESIKGRLYDLEKKLQKIEKPAKTQRNDTSNEKIVKKSSTKQLNLQKSNSPVYSNLKTVLYKISPRSIQKVSNVLFSQKKSLDFGHNTVTTFPSGLKEQKIQIDTKPKKRQTYEKPTKTEREPLKLKESDSHRLETIKEELDKLRTRITESFKRDKGLMQMFEKPARV